MPSGWWFVRNLGGWLVVLCAVCAKQSANCAEPATPSAATTTSSPSEALGEQAAALFTKRCIACHGGDKREAGLDLRTRDGVTQGGDSGPAVVAGDLSASLLLSKVSAGAMPPEGEGEALSADDLALVSRWVAAGAPAWQVADDTGAASRVTEDDRAFWSFRPPVSPQIPLVRQTALVRTPIDAFVLARLEAAGLSFNPEASRDVLLRRVCFDLTGLPPTPEQYDEFLADTRPDAYERLVVRLLASPRYGERWARRWLDVAGYADSDGYLAADRLRPEAWRYRDYVIRAFNNDLPYDLFVRQQLAGDELVEWRSAAEVTPEMVDSLVATGFLRTASDPTYPGYIEPNECHQVIADTIQIVGTSLLGLTVHCARCHQHKFDPVSQRDYYGLHAILFAALDPQRWQPSEVRGIPLATEAEISQAEAHNKQVDERLAELTGNRDELTRKYQRKRLANWLANLNRPVAENFTELGESWVTSLAGTASGWEKKTSAEGLSVTAIEGTSGYAIARLTRPVRWSGEFETSMEFSWTSADTDSKSNTAMQAVFLNLRDPRGIVLAGAGYIDENNTARGSPLTAISAGADPVAEYLAKYQQAVPPSPRARALPPAGTATVRIRRDSSGSITAEFAGGGLTETLTATSTAAVTTIEIEFRRYVLDPGATFEGLRVGKVEGRGSPQAVESADAPRLLADAIAAPADARTPEQQKIVAEFGTWTAPGDYELRQRYPDFVSQSDLIGAAMAAEQALKKSFPLIRGLVDVDAQPREQRIFQRGDYNKLGAAVEPCVPEVLSTVGYRLAPREGAKTTGRRRALAEWLTSADHPLTARVYANRIWAQHFGRGIVPTVANFGRSGVLPTHPELLDWLATHFVRSGWSTKELHRWIVLSSAYRQSSAHDASKAAIDPENHLLWAWRARRHEGEVVRDAVLAVSGQMNDTMYGPPAQVTQLDDGSVLTEDTPEGRRRSIYLIVRRSQPLTMLELFDTPNMEINCPERVESTVPMQALAMLHGPFAQRSAAALAERLTAATGDLDGQVQSAYKLLFARAPSDSECQRVRQFVDEFVATTVAGNAADAEEDRLAARQQALVQLCLVWLNSNEFMFVD